MAKGTFRKLVSSGRIVAGACLAVGCSSAGSGGGGASGAVGSGGFGNFGGFGATGASGGEAGAPAGGGSFGGASAAGGAGGSAGSAAGGSSGCTAEQALCPKGCADLTTDSDNCGSCGYSCTSQLGAKGYCNAGKCACSADTATDADNCGTCGNKCSAPSVPGAIPICQQGGCSWACPTGTTQCSGACSDLTKDAKNCGACGTECYAWGTPVCTNATCVPGIDPHATWRQQCVDQVNQLLSAKPALSHDVAKDPCVDSEIAGGTPTTSCKESSGSAYCKASTTFASVTTNCLPAITGQFQAMGYSAKSVSCGFWLDAQGAITVLVDFFD